MLQYAEADEHGSALNKAFLRKNGPVTSSAYGPLETETCRDVILPALERVGWRSDQIKSAYPINRGRIRATALLHRQDRPLIADYVLEYSDGLPVAVIEAKRAWRDPMDGYEQVKRYASLLDVPFAYTTNGDAIIEIDGRTGRTAAVTKFPSPDELWHRYRQDRNLEEGEQERLASAPFIHEVRNWDGTPKNPRYYQQVAINQVVQAIARGDRRLLLVLATGTGKTLVAAQIVAKLWNSDWPDSHRKPRVLYLADRRILIDQPIDDYFHRMFGEAVHRLGGGDARTSRNLYFALYQSLDQQGDEDRLYQRFEPDFFDLVIVDECHRGSATENSRWRAILEHFSPAVQLGLTATPVSARDTDTYGYFGPPRYEYSLAQGIDDGFLAPYRVRRVRMNIDLTGWRPEPGQRDLNNREIPDQLYTPRQYERTLAILERTEEAARYLKDYMIRTGPMNKMIVFCQDTEHAGRMTRALSNENSDLVVSYGSSYVSRITARDEEAGRERLDEFRQVDTTVPVIAVTSRLLTTGVDIPTLRTIVLFRIINSMPEFKQIIGRGTRLFPEEGKFSFDIVDFVEATRLFNDPRFDGPPITLYHDETDDDGHIADTIADEPVRVGESEAGYDESPGGELPPSPDVTDEGKKERILASNRKFFVDGVDVVREGEAFYIYDPDSERLRLKTFRQWVSDQVMSLNLDRYELLNQWASMQTRKALREHLDEWHITAEDLAEWTGHPEADTIDLLLFVTWQLPLLSRAERARRLERHHRQFLDSFSPAAREVLDKILDRYAERGSEELDVSALRTEAYSDLGTLVELSQRFGDRSGARMRDAIDELGKLLYTSA